MRWSQPSPRRPAAYASTSTSSSGNPRDPAAGRRPPFGGCRSAPPASRHAGQDLHRRGDVDRHWAGRSSWELILEPSVANTSRRCLARNVNTLPPGISARPTRGRPSTRGGMASASHRPILRPGCQRGGGGVVVGGWGGPPVIRHTPWGGRLVVQPVGCDDAGDPRAGVSEEAGANPARSRHCDREVGLPRGPPGREPWEGRRTRDDPGARTLRRRSAVGLLTSLSVRLAAHLDPGVDTRGRSRRRDRISVLRRGRP